MSSTTTFPRSPAAARRALAASFAVLACASSHASPVPISAPAAATRVAATAPPCAAPERSVAPVAPGCEGATLTFAPVTDARGGPVVRWMAGPEDGTAAEGEALLKRLLESDRVDVVALGEEVRRWSEANVHHPYAHYVLGRVLSDLGRPVEATAAYQQAITLAPGFAEAEYNLGVLRYGGGAVAEGLAHFERAAALAPDLADAFYNAGTARYLAGDHARALSLWCAGRRASPQEFSFAKKVVQALHALGRFADAERARASVRQLLAASSDPRLRRLTSYVIDQLRVGDEEVTVEEMLGARDEALRYHYRFVCSRGDVVMRAVTLESSPVAGQRGVAAVVGVEMPGGVHRTTRHAYREVPTYEALRPVALELIRALQRGDASAICATSPPIP